MSISLRLQREQERIERRAPVVKWRDDDYAVLDYEVVIGRIYRELVPAGVKWPGFFTSWVRPRIAAARTRSTRRRPNWSQLRTKPVGRMKLTVEQRRALGILAGARHGATEALMLANGFKPKLLAGLVLAGLATVETETVRPGGPTMKVERYCITDAGRQALLP